MVNVRLCWGENNTGFFNYSETCLAHRIPIPISIFRGNKSASLVTMIPPVPSIALY